MGFAYLAGVLAIVGWVWLAIKAGEWVNDLTGSTGLSFMTYVAVVGFPIALFITIIGG